MTDQEQKPAAPSLDRIGGFYSREKEIQRAKQLGTYGKIDRTEQYRGRYSPESLLKSDNYQWARLRRLEALQFRHAVYIAIASCMLSNAPAMLRWFWNWLGGMVR
jgi:hypothetical protein